MTTDIKDILSMIWPAISLLANLWMFFSLRRMEKQKASEEQLTKLTEQIAKKASEERVSKLESLVVERHAEHGERLVALEQNTSADDIRHIYKRIDELAQSLSSLAGEFRGVNRTLQLIQEHLLRG